MDELITASKLRQDEARGEGPTLIDVRAPEEFAAGHLPGARNIPADEVARHLAEIPRDRPVVTYCNMRHRGTSRGERAAELLRASGYQARALEGGFPGWQSAGNPVETGPST
jgi:rhodanese-related sulfurtransferase